MLELLDRVCEIVPSLTRHAVEASSGVRSTVACRSIRCTNKWWVHTSLWVVARARSGHSRDVRESFIERAGCEATWDDWLPVNAEGGQGDVCGPSQHSLKV